MIRVVEAIHEDGKRRWEPLVVHCYVAPEAIEDESNQAKLAAFCRRMGRETKQGEIGLVIADEYLAIRDYEEAE